MLAETLDIIHQPRTDLDTLSRAQAEAYLNTIADALIEGWGEQLELIANESNFRRYDPNCEPIDAILAAFRATESTRGIMKVAVIINHQWVVKLGCNAVKEADLYEEADDYLRELYVPTVHLGNVGCLQLKLELPEKDASNWHFKDATHENQYTDIMLRVEDCHRANVGIWQGMIVAIDFEGG